MAGRRNYAHFHNQYCVPGDFPQPPPAPPKGVGRYYIPNRYFLPVKCFAPGTDVLCPDGARAIETLKPGDDVLAYDVRTRTVVRALVEDLECFRGDFEMLRLSTGGDDAGIDVTREHAFFDGSNWVSTEWLGNEGRPILTATGELVASVSQSDQRVQSCVYNVRTTAGSYLVGKAGFIASDQQRHASHREQVQRPTAQSGEVLSSR